MNIYRKSLMEVVRNPIPALFIGLVMGAICLLLMLSYWYLLFQPLLAFAAAFLGRLSANKKLLK